MVNIDFQGQKYEVAQNIDLYALSIFQDIMGDPSNIQLVRGGTEYAVMFVPTLPNTLYTKENGGRLRWTASPYLLLELCIELVIAQQKQTLIKEAFKPKSDEVRVYLGFVHEMFNTAELQDVVESDRKIKIHCDLSFLSQAKDKPKGFIQKMKELPQQIAEVETLTTAADPVATARTPEERHQASLATAASIQPGNMPAPGQPAPIEVPQAMPAPVNVQDQIDAEIARAEQLINNSQ
jgi:hypothetical protein